ncbi:hypothetical protein C1646_766374 [Rhizophagus diaphanus]|nr:hypothetical protein C1646_766374 [Rhizophagus diaphanus] [Rhizophagus sp. MUCL 43196]
MIKIKILFVLILLMITISSIEAIQHQLVKRTTKFGQCDSRIKTLNVKTNPSNLVPNSEVALDIKGNLESDLNENSKLFVTVTYYDWTYDYGFNGDICSITKCPVPANTDFNLQTKVLLKDLPTDYIFSIAIFINYDENQGRPEACALAS